MLLPPGLELPNMSLATPRPVPVTRAAPAVSVSSDLTRTVLAVLLIGVLISASLLILSPFLLSIIWATMIVVATWPVMLAVQSKLRRRTYAVIVMTGAMLLVFIVPLLLAIQTLIDNIDAITAWLRALATFR